MKVFSRTALAVFSLGLSALGAATGLAAALTPDADQGLLLPQSVIAEAEREALIPSPYTIIPEGRDPEAVAPSIPLKAGSLAELVRAKSGISIANREEECLAGAVYFESKSESLDGQLAVAQVILNREKSGRFASSICGVVFQPGQFSFVRGNGFPPIARNSQDWRDAVAIARIARDGLWKSKVPNALFFHASHVSPGWRMTRVAAVGNHVFYR
jgi:N-acetylmuramoyl-L-alanine amidase